MPKKSSPALVPTQRQLPSALLAVVCGLLMGGVFPPVDWKWLVWVGLVPLIVVIRRNPQSKKLFLYGYLAGFVFFVMNLHPLVSAHSWTGWAAESVDVFASRMNRQWWFMQGIWIAFAVWCAVWWGIWAWAAGLLSAGQPWRLLTVAPALWLISPEWLRAHTTFGFAWAFLGNATADWPAVRQLAAIGGVWLLSALVVAVNVGVCAALRGNASLQERRVSITAAGMLILAILYGAARIHQPLPGNRRWLAAAIQRAKPSYTTEDFEPATGFDRGYAPRIRQALAQGVRLIMLPESIALGAMTLDGSPSSTKPPPWQHARRAWEQQMAQLLEGSSSVIMLGLDTVEAAADHNTLVAWNAHQTVGWYHKRRLVPFAEYEPWPWAPWAIHGKSEYSPGRGSQLIKLSDDVIVGGFICQEVLFPRIARSAARDGATLLVSGGNDGVFGDPAVAQVHADAAQIRSVETGRFLVRAMKTGISAILDPYGNELARSQSSEPVVLVEQVSAMTSRTPYVRYGDWMVYLSCLIILLSLFKGSEAGRQP